MKKSMHAKLTGLMTMGMVFSATAFFSGPGFLENCWASLREPSLATLALAACIILGLTAFLIANSLVSKMLTRTATTDPFAPDQGKGWDLEREGNGLRGHASKKHSRLPIVGEWRPRCKSESAEATRENGGESLFPLSDDDLKAF